MANPQIRFSQRQIEMISKWALRARGEYIEKIAAARNGGDDESAIAFEAMSEEVDDILSKVNRELEDR